MSRSQLLKEGELSAQIFQEMQTAFVHENMQRPGDYRSEYKGKRNLEREARTKSYRSYEDQEFIIY